MNKQCININIKWEDKGILLGIIYYILKKRNKFKKLIISLWDDKFRAILSHIFRDIKFVKQNGQFKINIKNIEQADLNINNLNNIIKINARKIYLIPWYDTDNPIIMYRIGQKIYDRQKIHEKVKVNDCGRGKPHGPRNFITDKCYNIWDTYMEYSILYKYYKKYNINVPYMYNLITNYLLSDLCIGKQIVTVPIKVPIYIPVKVPVKSTSGDSFSQYTDLINLISNKIDIVNKMLDSK